MTCIRVTQSASGSAIGRLLAGALLVVGLPSGAAWVASPLTAPNYPLPSGERNGPVADRPGNPIAADTVEWRFSEPQPDWKPTLRAPGSMVAGLQRTNDALRVTLFEAGSRLSGIGAPDWTVNVGIPDVEGGVYIDLPDWRREGWAEVLVRARTTSTVTMMSIGLNPREGAIRADAPSMAATFQITGAVTPIVRDGRVHTYRIHLDWGPERTGPWRRLGLSFSAPVSGSIDLLSVRVVPVAAEQPPNRVMETTLEPPQLKSDFALLRRALEEAHPAMYRHTAKRRMDAEFARAEATLTRPMTVLEFSNVLAPVIAAIKDGHTHFASYQGDEISAVLAAAKQFPLALTFQSRRAFVVLNHGLDGRVKPGMEVLAINGRSFADILQRILPNLPRDGDVEGWPLYKLGISRGFFQVGHPGRTGFGAAYRLYVEDPPSFRTTLRDPHTHQTIAVDLPGVTVAEAAVNGEQNPVNREVLAGLRTIRALNNTARQSIRYLEGEHAAILVPAYGDDFPDFLREAFAGLSDRGTKHLIIDMRGNTGGYDVYPVLLFSYLTSNEFRPIEGNRVSTFQPSYRQYTTLEIADLATDIYYGPASGLWKPDPRGGWLMTEKYPSIGLRQPAENHFDGPVFVLIDGGCFSACSAFTALADYYQRATFVGEETGGVGSGGAGTDVGPTLPESHLHVGFPMESYFFLVEMRNPRRGTLPTHAVMQSVDDLAKGRDTVLEFTLELIRSGKGQ